MFINGGANVLNIIATVCLAFGLGPIPELSVVGISIVTAVADTVAAVTFLAMIEQAIVRRSHPTDDRETPARH